MRRVAFMQSVSLDGRMAAPDGDLSWHRVDDELHRHFNDRLGAAGLFLEGRVTYALMDAFWPTADEDPDNPEPMREFRRPTGARPQGSVLADAANVGRGGQLRREVDPDEVRAWLAEPGEGSSWVVPTWFGPSGGTASSTSIARRGTREEATWAANRPTPRRPTTASPFAERCTAGSAGGVLARSARRWRARLARARAASVGPIYLPSAQLARPWPQRRPPRPQLRSAGRRRRRVCRERR